MKLRTDKPLPTIRIGDQLLIVRPKPWTWRCHYENCGHVVAVRIKVHLPQAVADHILFAHIGEGQL